MRTCGLISLLGGKGPWLRDTTSRDTNRNRSSLMSKEAGALQLAAAILKWCLTVANLVGALENMLIKELWVN